MAKAFDTVNHKELINILPGFGINGKSLSWFSSYLENRTQLVSIINVLNSKKQIDCGVPTDSILGLILFILYINGICELNTGGSVITYADDTCLLFLDKSWEMVKKNYYKLK